MKKLTLRKVQVLACLILLCIISIQSCRKDLLQPKSYLVQQQLSIAEAKQYFDKHIMASKPNKDNQLMSANSSSHNHDGSTIDGLLGNKKVLWNHAYEQLISIGVAVKIPLDFGTADVIINQNTKAAVPFGSLNYLLMYKDSLQNIHTEWVNLQPDSAWLYGNRGSYTGSIVVKNWNGAVLKKYAYPDLKSTIGSRKGVLMSANTLLSNNQNVTSSAINICVRIRRSIEFCTCQDKYHCDYRTCNVCGITICGTVEDDCLLCDNPPTSPTTPIPGENPGGNPPLPGPGGGSPNPTDYPPSPCNPDPNYVPVTYPDGSMSLPPCIPVPHGPDLPPPAPLTAGQLLVNRLDITDLQKVSFINSNEVVAAGLMEYLFSKGDTPEIRDFLKWAIGYLMENPNFQVFKNRFMPTVEIIADPDPDNWTDSDNEIVVDPDQTVYQQYQDNQPWQTINQVVKFEDFVPNRYVPGSLNNETVNCLKLAKEQLGKKGYTVSGFYIGSPQIYQTYTEAGGVDVSKTRQAINYMMETLKKGIPVLVGVDVKPGAPLANKDKSSDHFIVIVGAGTDSKGKYFQFMDSSTNWPTLGASQSNKLYFDPLTGKITGKTMSQYGSRSNRHDFILTQVRKSIKK